MEHVLTFVKQKCGVCGMWFALTEDFKATRKAKTTRTFFCPEGHGLSYTETEEDELRRRIVAADSARDYWKKQCVAQEAANAALLRKINSLKGVVTRLKRALASASGLS